jgi:hypothetical protein
MPSEQELAAAAKAPRVNQGDIERAIREGKVSYTVLPNGRTTVCCIEIFNGRFSVTGESSCVSKENFNEVYGQNIAFKEAEQKLWPVLGAILAWRLSKIDAAGEASCNLLPLDSDTRTYVGTKVVHGTPMTRGEYNALRGWTVPENEDPNDAGYLVEYTDGGESNMIGFTGYISWSPKAVFERAYTIGVEPKATTYVDRLRAELAHETEKFEKLLAFLGSDHFTKLAKADQRDLLAQKPVMEEFCWLLGKRLKRAENPSPVVLGH